MNSNQRLGLLFSVLVVVLLSTPLGWTQTVTAPEPSPILTVDFDWQTVVNNGVVVPADTRKFNSFNQPSMNVNRLVVFRARSKGGTTGEPAHGVWSRDMSNPDPDAHPPLVTIFDRKTTVPQPNNQNVQFIEPPAFPRIDMWSNTIASRAGHQPSWEYENGIDPVTGLPLTTRVGTSGIYTNPFGDLILGASTILDQDDLEGPQFDFFKVPDLTVPTKFDVFPGAPAVANANTIAFKGNYTVPAPTADDPLATISKTGVYFRTLTNASIGRNNDLAPAGGKQPVVVIANSDTVIPKQLKGGTVKFGSTAPPSAVGDVAVFAGFDNEDAPTLGGIYKAKLTGSFPDLKTLVKIGDKVPGEGTAIFNKIGEGLSFDGRFVGFWGAWGSETKELVLQCPTDGNKNRIAYCKELYGEGGASGTVSAGFHTLVPVHQGIFVYDISTGAIRVVAKSPTDFSDFLYWNFSGRVPPPKGGDGGDGGEGDLVATAEEGGGSEGGGSDEGGEEDGEPARWRSAAFVAVSGLVDSSLTNSTFDAAFKARTGAFENGAYVNPKDGIYLRKGPDPASIIRVVETGMDGTKFDPAATYIPEDEEGNPLPGASPLPLPVTAMGIERDGFRGNGLALTITMANEFAGWAGIYLTTVPPTF